MLLRLQTIIAIIYAKTKIIYVNYIIKTLKLTLALLVICSCEKENIVVSEITIENHRFIPETLYIPEGKKIKLIVHNKDDTMEEFESYKLKREKLIPPNSKANIILAPLKVGEYSFFGEFHDETAKGKIIVQPRND